MLELDPGPHFLRSWILICIFYAAGSGSAFRKTTGQPTFSLLFAFSLPFTLCHQNLVLLTPRCHKQTFQNAENCYKISSGVKYNSYTEPVYKKLRLKNYNLQKASIFVCLSQLLILRNGVRNIQLCNTEQLQIAASYFNKPRYITITTYRFSENLALFKMNIKNSLEKNSQI